MSKGVIAVVAFVLFSLTHSVYARDTDSDGLSDADEITLGTDPAVADDTDGDGIFLHLSNFEASITNFEFDPTPMRTKPVNLHARLTHSGIELHPIYDPDNTCIIQYISRS